MMNPKSEALAYRIWAHCKPLGWNTTLIEVADALGVSVDRVRGVSQSKGWLHRFRRTSTDGTAGRRTDHPSRHDLAAAGVAQAARLVA